MGVAVNQRGQVVMTERDGDCVTLYSPSEESLQSFGTPGQFQHPQGVAMDGEENILIVDCLNYRIQKFTMQGDFIKAEGTQGSGPLQFNRPRGIAYNASNNPNPEL